MINDAPDVDFIPHVVNNDPVIPNGDVKDLQDDDYVPLSNVQNAVSPANVRPARDRRPPQR